MIENKPNNYRDLMLDSLGTRVTAPPVGEFPFPKDDSHRAIDEAMRALAEKEKAERDEEIRARNEKARIDGRMRACRENLDFLTRNGYALFADPDDDGQLVRFLAIVFDCAGKLLPEGRRVPSLILQTELVPAQKELLARACARLVGVEPDDLFDSDWCLKLSAAYLAECLRAREIVTDGRPDFEKIEQVLGGNS